MAQTWPELLDRARHAPFDPERFMHELLAAERADREVRSVSYQMRVARFPAHRDLAGFNFTQARVDESLIRRLHTGEFLASAQNVVRIPAKPDSCGFRRGRTAVPVDAGTNSGACPQVWC